MFCHSQNKNDGVNHWRNCPDRNLRSRHYSQQCLNLPGLWVSLRPLPRRLWHHLHPRPLRQHLCALCCAPPPRSQVPWVKSASTWPTWPLPTFFSCPPYPSGLATTVAMVTGCTKTSCAGWRGSFFFINNYCSILFLGAISVNRYWAVTRPLDAASSDHRRRGIIVCIVIWAVTIAMQRFLNWCLQEPSLMRKTSLAALRDIKMRLMNRRHVVAAIHFAIIGMFFVVFFLVVVCNCLIARALLSQNPSQPELRFASTMSRQSKRPRGVKRRALQMLLAVVGVFVLCFLPHHIIQGPWALAVLQINQGWGHVDWDQGTVQTLNDAHQITLVLMGLNCILDPVVYFFATRKFRRFIVSHVKRIGKGEGCTDTATSQISMDSKNPSQRLHSEIQQPGMDWFRHL